ncbi:hypothetical protein Tco_1476209 [Tanacetum coccineum]
MKVKSAIRRRNNAMAGVGDRNRIFCHSANRIRDRSGLRSVVCQGGTEKTFTLMWHRRSEVSLWSNMLDHRRRLGHWLGLHMIDESILHQSWTAIGMLIKLYHEIIVRLPLLVEELDAMRTVGEDEILSKVVEAPDLSLNNDSLSRSMGSRPRVKSIDGVDDQVLVPHNTTKFCKPTRHRLNLYAIFINGHLPDLNGTKFVIKINCPSIPIVMEQFFQMIP